MLHAGEHELMLMWPAIATFLYLVTHRFLDCIDPLRDT
jgi:hypothetical protein